jgi:chemotaxis protein MotB
MSDEIAALQANLEAKEAAMAALESASQAERLTMTFESEVEQARLQGEVDSLTAELESTRDSLARAVSGRSARDAELARMAEAVADLERRRAQADAALAEFRDLVGRFQSMIDAGTLRVRVVDGRMVVELATDILFAPARATVSEEGQAALVEVTGVLASLAGRQFQVAGHTDNRPIATEKFPSNWELGAARAIAVTKLMIENELPATRVSGVSYGDTKPAASNETDEGRALNRRIEIVIVPDLSEMPGYDELSALTSGAE